MKEGKVLTTPSDRPKPAKKRGGFKPGQSGNPAGRPKGAKNHATLVKQAIATECQDILERDMPKILKHMVQTALKGDAEMQRYLVNKFIPNAVADTKAGAKRITAIHISVNADKPTVIEGTDYEEESSSEGEPGDE